MNTDRIRIMGLEGFGYHGVLPGERAVGQRFVVDVVLGVLVADAAAADDLRRTADYGQVALGVHELITGPPVALIETLAVRIAERCLLDPAVLWVEVTVHKPGAPVPVPFTDVAVTVRRSQPVRRAAFGLGGNVGDVEASLRRAVGQLADSPLLDVVAVSDLYRTAPVGGPEQPDFLNAVVTVDTSAAPSNLLSLARAIESSLHRVRTQRWGPRTVDVDVLAIGDLMLEGDDLIVPHPRAHLRAFVLIPWAQVDPTFEVPGRGAVANLAHALGEDGVQRLRSDGWWRG